MTQPRSILPREIVERRDNRKREILDRVNGTLDPWYGCFLWEHMLAYAGNYTFPYSEFIHII